MRFCNHCGEEIIKNEDYCLSCGKSLKISKYKNNHYDDDYNSSKKKRKSYKRFDKTKFTDEFDE